MALNQNQKAIEIIDNNIHNPLLEDQLKFNTLQIYKKDTMH